MRHLQLGNLDRPTEFVLPDEKPNGCFGISASVAPLGGPDSREGRAQKLVSPLAILAETSLLDESRGALSLVFPAPADIAYYSTKIVTFFITTYGELSRESSAKMTVRRSIASRHTLFGSPSPLPSFLPPSTSPSPSLSPMSSRSLSSSSLLPPLALVPSLLLVLPTSSQERSPSDAVVSPVLLDARKKICETGSWVTAPRASEALTQQ